MPSRDKWLFRPALSPGQLDEREAAAPSELFTADPFKWDNADPQTQVSNAVVIIFLLIGSDSNFPLTRYYQLPSTLLKIPVHLS